MLLDKEYMKTRLILPFETLGNEGIAGYAKKRRGCDFALQSGSALPHQCYLSAIFERHFWWYFLGKRTLFASASVRFFSWGDGWAEISLQKLFVSSMTPPVFPKIIHGRFIFLRKH